MTDLQRFLEHINKRGPKQPHMRSRCWVWFRGSKVRNYGQFAVQSRKVLAHRWAYEHWVGPIPDGIQVLHRCDHPPCCRPSHLFLGSHLDNMADMTNKGRRNPSIGHANGNSVLTEEKVLDILRLVAAGSKQREAGAKYGVTQATVSDIVNGRTWGHLQLEGTR